MRQGNHPEPATALGQEWQDWIVAYPVGAERLEQSLSLLRAGLVEELRVDGGSVEGEVMDGVPCRVVVQFSPHERRQWNLWWEAMTPEALKEFRKGGLGKVLRDAFAVAELSLLPERYKEVRTVCTCPDWIRPCRHSLAVLRALGEEIERDPMLLVRLRGGGPEEEVEAVTIEAPAAGEALRADEESYWGDGAEWGAFEKALLSGGTPARLLKRLGPVSVYGVRMEPEAVFKPVYEGVAAEAKVMLEGIQKKVKK